MTIVLVFLGSIVIGFLTALVTLIIAAIIVEHHFHYMNARLRLLRNITAIATFVAVSWAVFYYTS